MGRVTAQAEQILCLGERNSRRENRYHEQIFSAVGLSGRGKKLIPNSGLDRYIFNFFFSGALGAEVAGLLLKRAGSLLRYFFSFVRMYYFVMQNVEYFSYFVRSLVRLPLFVLLPPIGDTTLPHILPTPLSVLT